MVAEVPDAERHLEFALRQLSDPRVWPWHWPEGGEVVPGPRTREQALDIVDRQAAECEEVGYCLWWWRERTTGDLVGYVGLDRTDVEGEPVVEVGWSISPHRWGEGLAAEAGRASVDWGFDVAGLDRIVSYTLHDNLASRRVMEKIGLRYSRDFVRKGFDQVLYELEAADR
ncbi:MAG: GNAT family N-acetyltransferase [Solirubrobacterales bacterium]